MRVRARVRVRARGKVRVRGCAKTEVPARTARELPPGEKAIERNLSS